MAGARSPEAYQTRLRANFFPMCAAYLHPAHSFPLPAIFVKVTRRGDKKHPAFFSKKEMTQAGRRRGRPDSVAQLLPVTNEKARSRKMHAFWRQSIRMRKEKGQGHLLTLPAMFW